MADVVLDASALLDLLLGNARGEAVRSRLGGHRLHAPAHLDAEVLSALGRLHRAGLLSEDDVELMLSEIPRAVIRRHPVHRLLRGAWNRRHQLRLADALYVELAAELGVLVTTDTRLRALPLVDVVGDAGPSVEPRRGVAAGMAGTYRAMPTTPAAPDQPYEPDPEDNEAPGLIPPHQDQPSGDTDKMDPRHAGPGVEE